MILLESMHLEKQLITISLRVLIAMNKIPASSEGCSSPNRKSKYRIITIRRQHQPNNSVTAFPEGKAQKLQGTLANIINNDIPCKGGFIFWLFAMSMLLAATWMSTIKRVCQDYLDWTIYLHRIGLEKDRVSCITTQHYISLILEGARMPTHRYCCQYLHWGKLCLGITSNLDCKTSPIAHTVLGLVDPLKETRHLPILKSVDLAALNKLLYGFSFRLRWFHDRACEWSNTWRNKGKKLMIVARESTMNCHDSVLDVICGNTDNRILQNATVKNEIMLYSEVLWNAAV